MTSVLDRLIARGAVPLHVPVLQPAEPFLELAGEELRRRIFLSEDERGRTRCLRPELTIPAARAHIAGHEQVASGAHGAARHALAGTVFRQRGPGEADEFPQGGIETIGGDEADMPANDARALADAVALVDALAPGRRASIVVGDRAVFAGALEAIGLSQVWGERLTRLHGQAHGLRLALASLIDGVPGIAREAALGASYAFPSDVSEALEKGDRNALIAAVADAIRRSRMDQGTRKPEEIATRLIERRTLRSAAPNERQRSALETWLAVECPVPEVRDELIILKLKVEPDRLSAEENGGGVLVRAFALHDKRIEALRTAGLDPASLTFQASLGRSLDYYTGLVFEVRDAAGTVLAAGGRYDRLLTLLGASTPERAVGFALWLDRLGVSLDGTRMGGAR